MPASRGTPTDAARAPWSYEAEILHATGARKIVLAEHGAPLAFGRALGLLAGDAGFRDFFSQLLAADTAPAFRWETPPLTRATLERRFECVLTDDPHLETRPQAEAFADYFTGAQAQAAVLAVPNLGRTAVLVVPRQMTEPGAYAHLARFLRSAPAAQVHALWQCVAQTTQSHLSPAPQWVSTAGRGVAWLHVRIENTPKYYSHRRMRWMPNAGTGMRRKR